MVKYKDADLNGTFFALADPTRRAIVMHLAERGGASVSDIAKPFAMSLPAVLKHLDVLSDAGLVDRIKEGRTVTCTLRADPMREAMDWLSRYQRFWSDQLDRLAAFLEEPLCSPDPASPSSATSKPPRKKSSKRGPTPRK